MSSQQPDTSNLPVKHNLLGNIASHIPEELFETIVQTPGVRIERIVSKGQRSPDQFWYDQDQAEWVLVVKGHARLAFEDGLVELRAGEYLNIAAHQKHRVDWTTPDEETVWLAVFY
jgi:cupin 2 domain-containing protein